MKRFVHTYCGLPLKRESRTIITLPSDPTWPHDQKVIVLYCAHCKRIVDPTEESREG